jgi:anaerobic magnesium-protoporphyrin IX monomethyl ester cyclase
MNADIMLVYPYFRTHAPTELLFQPLGIASLASQIKSLGLSVAACDCTFSTFEQAIEKIAAGKPAVLGISVMITLSAHASRMVKALRKRLPKTLFVCGGPLPTLYPDHFAREFDCVFRGESDLVFPAFCRDYLANGNRKNLHSRLDPSQYPGLVHCTGSTFPGRPLIHHSRATRDTLPLPDRSGGEHARYQQFWLDKTGCKPASILLTKGCPFQCDFCSKPVFGDFFQTRSIVNIMDEIDDIKRYGYDQLWIADDCFTLDGAFLEEFCRSLLLSRAGITWTCLARPDGLTDGAIRLMRSAGCVKIYMGLESGDNETLRLMNKKTTVEIGIRAVHTLHDSGIKVGGFFIVGYPGETKDSIEKTFSLALSLPLADISFNVPFPLPGSALYSRVSGLDADADWAVENETKFVYCSEFDTDWLKERIAETLRSFHAAK